MPLILEGLLTTSHQDGSPHLAPLGPIVDADVTAFLLRPYHGSTTCANLLRTRRGVFHVTDDVELLALTAIGELPDPPPRMRPFPDTSQGESPAPPDANLRAPRDWILENACRWYALEITAVDDSQPRLEMQAHVVASGRIRDFFGLNRAKHAVVEAAILATRLHLAPRENVLAEFARLSPLIDKTGGPAERRAFQRLTQYVESASAPTAESQPPVR